jgi:hypothetical protein
MAVPAVFNRSLCVYSLNSYELIFKLTSAKEAIIHFLSDNFEAFLVVFSEPAFIIAQDEVYCQSLLPIEATEVHIAPFNIVR